MILMAEGDGLRSKPEQKKRPLAVVVECGSPVTPEVIGDRLRVSIGQVLGCVSQCALRPSELSRTLDVSRVMVSRLLSSIGKTDPLELLTSIPGPESLRSIVRAAERGSVSKRYIGAALEAINDFDHLIRDQFGTRAALNAALSVGRADTRERFEQSSRYQVFKGMSQVLGVQSKVWLTCMMLTPSKENDHAIDISTIHGTCGLRRLRPDMPIHFTYGIPPKYKDMRQSPERMRAGLTPFLSNMPAPLSVVEENGQIINTFAPEIGGKDALYDMLAEVHVPNGSDRRASAGRSWRGTSVIPDVPVVTLVSDVIIHGDIFEGIDPQLFVYNTVSRGGADIEDPKRDVDRVMTDDQITDRGSGLDNLAIAEIPRYTDMVAYLSAQHGFTPECFRTYRLQVQYPIYGFQYVMGFKVGNGEPEGTS